MSKAMQRKLFLLLRLHRPPQKTFPSPWPTFPAVTHSLLAHTGLYLDLMFPIKETFDLILILQFSLYTQIPIAHSFLPPLTPRHHNPHTKGKVLYASWIFYLCNSLSTEISELGCIIKVTQRHPGPSVSLEYSLQGNKNTIGFLHQPCILLSWCFVCYWISLDDNYIIYAIWKGLKSKQKIVYEGF